MITSQFELKYLKQKIPVVSRPMITNEGKVLREIYGGRKPQKYPHRLKNSTIRGLLEHFVHPQTQSIIHKHVHKSLQCLSFESSHQMLSLLHTSTFQSQSRLILKTNSTVST